MVFRDRRTQRAASSSSHPWCVRYGGEQPLFEQAGRGAVRLEVGGVDHQLVGLPAACGEGGEDLVEHAEPAPPDEAVVDRLVRAIRRRRIPPAQAVPDHEDDPADHPAVVYASNSVRKRKIRLDPAHLRL